MEAERFGYLLRRVLSMLEAYHRGAGNGSQIVDAGEAPDKRLGHPVCKVFLSCVAREALQRKHGQRLDSGLGRFPKVSPDQTVSESQQDDRGYACEGKPATRIGSPFCPFVVLLPRKFRSLLFWFFLERQLTA